MVVWGTMKMTPLLAAYIAKQSEFLAILPESQTQLFRSIIADIENGKTLRGVMFSYLRLGKLAKMLKILPEFDTAADMTEFKAATAEYMAANP